MAKRKIETHADYKSNIEELLHRIGTSNIELKFDSSGMTPLQTMIFLLEESQRLIYEELEIDVFQLCLAKEIRKKVKHKMPLNIINELKGYICIEDKAGVYKHERYIKSSNPYTVQELIEELMHHDPYATVVLGNLNVGTYMKSNPTAEYMLDDETSNRLIMNDDFHPSLEDKMKKVLVLEASIPKSDESRTTPYAMCYSRQGDIQEMIKWMFKATEHVIDGDEDIHAEVMSQLDFALENGGCFDRVLEVLGKHVEWIEVV